MSIKTILVENTTKKQIVLKEYGVREVGSGATTFLGLTDTPSAFAGSENYIVKVKGDGSGLEFVDQGASTVTSVFSRTGDIVAEAGDYAGIYATAAQGALADTALQPGDNISELTNDAGYITAAQGGLQEIVEDTSPQLGGDLDLNTHALSQPGGNDFTIDVKGMATGDNFKLISDSTEVINVGFDGSTFVMDMDNGGLSTRIIGLPTNQTPIPSEALSYQFLIDNGVLNPMVDSLDANQNDVVNANIVFFGDVAQGSSTSGIASSAQALAAIPAITSTQTAGLTTNPADNMVFIVPEENQPFAVSSDSGTSITLRYPTIDGTANQVLTTDGLGNATWQDNSAVTPPVDSVDGRTGVVTLTDLYAPLVHTHVKADITDFSDADYATAAQGALADTATQPGDNVSELANDAGYITLGEVPVDVVTSVHGRTGDVVALVGDYSAFYAPLVHTHVEADITDLDKYTQAEVDQAFTDHVNASDPHPQYLTPNDLPSTVVSWYTDNTSAVDGTFMQSVRTQPSEPESTVQATGASIGVPVLLGQWLRDAAFPEAFELFETATTFQIDVDCSNTNCELYIEFWQRAAGGGDKLLSTSDLVPLSSNRQTYTGQIITPGPIQIGAGDRSFTRIYINKNAGGADPVVTLFMEGNGVTRVVTQDPIATFPAPHAETHEVGGTDQINHDNLLNANGNDSHSVIDSKIAALETNAFLDGDTIDNGTY